MEPLRALSLSSLALLGKAGAELLELGIGEGSRSLPTEAGSSNKDQRETRIGGLRSGH